MEINFYCKYCKFIGKSLFLIKQHVQTKNHIVLSKNNVVIKNYTKKFYKCFECDTVSDDRSNIKKHMKNIHRNTGYTPTKSVETTKTTDIECKSSVDDIINVIKLTSTMTDEDVKLRMIRMFLDEKDKFKNKELELTSKMKDIYENENEFHKNVAVNAGQIVNKTMNVLTFAVQNLKDTPKLKILDSVTARKLLKHETDAGCLKRNLNNDQTAEYIAKLSEAKILHNHLGNTLVSHYKQEDSNHQSLWTTDVNRIKFITRTDDGWIKDANGDIINRTMINPLLQEVGKILDEYCTSKLPLLDKMTGLEEARYVEVVEQRINIKSDILTRKMNKSIIKYIAPYFIMKKQIGQ